MAMRKAQLRKHAAAVTLCSVEKPRNACAHSDVLLFI